MEARVCGNGPRWPGESLGGRGSERRRGPGRLRGPVLVAGRRGHAPVEAARQGAASLGNLGRRFGGSPGRGAWLLLLGRFGPLEDRLQSRGRGRVRVRQTRLQRPKTPVVVTVLGLGQRLGLVERVAPKLLLMLILRLLRLVLAAGGSERPVAQPGDQSAASAEQQEAKVEQRQETREQQQQERQQHNEAR